MTHCCAVKAVKALKTAYSQMDAAARFRSSRTPTSRAIPITSLMCFTTPSLPFAFHHRSNVQIKDRPHNSPRPDTFNMAP